MLLMEESIQNWVLAQMGALLDIPMSQIDIRQTFMEIGGNSLLAVKLMTVCRRREVQLSVESILGSQNIATILDHAVRDSSEQVNLLLDEAASTEYDDERDDSDYISENTSIDSLLNISPASTLNCKQHTPVTEMQLALIHGTQRFPTRNVINYFETHPAHRLPILRHAWQTVISMEPIFRTKFDLRNGGQLIEQTEAPFIWRESTVKDKRSYQRALQDAPSLSDLEQSDEGCQVMLGNRFEAITLLNDDDGTHISTIIWRVHHALVDGYSANLLLEKVRRVSAGLPVRPSPSFATIAARLYQLQKTSAEAAKQFWQQRYAAFPSASSQLLFPPSQETSGHPELVSFRTPIDLAMIAQQNGVTVAAICYAAWALTLTLFTDSDTVVFGAVLAGRNLPIPGIDEAIGPLVNTLPMHIHVDRTQTIRQFLQAVFRGLVELSSFQWSLPEHGFHRHFASALSMQFDMSAIEGEKTLAPIEPPYSLSQTDIPISIFIEVDGTFRIQYHTNTFRTQDIQILAEHYQQALSILSRPSGTGMGQCQDDMLTSEGRRMLRILGNWDSTRSQVSSIKENLTSLFQRTVDQYPSHIAVEKGDVRLTYSQLQVAATKVARRLSPYISKGDVVCLHADRSVEWICGIYGILFAGAVYCPLDASLPQALRESYYISAAARVFLSPSRNNGAVQPTGCTAISVEEALDDPDTKEMIQVEADFSSQAPAYICFTSGSTGKPKGVICTHAGLTAFQSDWTVRLKAQPGWKIAQTMSVAFDGSIHEIFSALSYGATLVLPNSADPFAHLSRVDACILTPSIAKVLDLTEFPLLSTVYLVGEPVPSEVNDRVSKTKTLYNMYGPTEGTGGATIGQLLPGKPVTIGRPNPSTRVYIMNRDLSLVPPGVIGEICIAGVQTAQGYIGMPVETAERFRTDPVCCGHNERMYRTGDQGYWDIQSQEVVCLGRKDRMIKLRGFRLDLNDIEARILNAVPTVSAVAVVVADKEDYLVAMVTPASVDTVHLATRIRSALPMHAVPRRLIAVDQFPMTAAGKRDYKAIAAARLETAAVVGEPLSAPVAKPLTTIETRVIRIWRSVLDLDENVPLDREANFYNLGGHSILQLHLATALTEEFGCRVPVSLVMDFPLLKEMAEMMNRLLLQTIYREETAVIHRRTDEQELSPIELEWWQKYQLNEGSSAFNVCFAARFDPARVDRRLLTAAWNTVLMRHRILRSRCVPTRRLGVRRKYADCPPQVERLDQLNLWHEVNRPFQLDRNHPIRVMISRDTLLVVVSHIVCDLTTLEVLNREVISLYRGEPLPEIKQQHYMEVVAHNTTSSACDLDFWTKYLAGSQGSENRFEAQFDRKSYRGSSFVVDIPPTVFAGMINLVTAQHLTLHQLALAAIALTMQVDRDHIDLVLGGPHFNRKTSKAQKTVGLFLEPLPIRIRDEEPNTPQIVADFLHAVQRQSQQALGHAVSWNRLLRHLDVDMDYPNHPLFDIMVTFHDHRGQQLFQLPGFDPIPVWAKGSKFKLMFEFTALAADQLMLRIEHDLDSYPLEVVRQISSLLLVALKLLTEGESYQVLRTQLRESFTSMKT